MWSQTANKVHWYHPQKVNGSSNATIYLGTKRRWERRKEMTIWRGSLVITVFYDDQCGLCLREIGVYKRADQKCCFKWQGLSDRSLDLKAEGLDLVSALEQLHVKDSSGDVHVGVDAFIMIWKHLPRWRILAFLASIPFLHWILKLAYEWFAKRRFQQLTHCQIALSKRSKE